MVKRLRVLEVDVETGAEAPHRWQSYAHVKPDEVLVRYQENLVAEWRELRLTGEQLTDDAVAMLVAVDQADHSSERKSRKAIANVLEEFAPLSRIAQGILWDFFDRQQARTQPAYVASLVHTPRKKSTSARRRAEAKWRRWQKLFLA